MPLACELHRGKTKRAGHAARDNPGLPSLCSAAKTRVPGCHASSQSPPPAQSRGRGPPRDCLSAVTRRGYAPECRRTPPPRPRRPRGPPRGCRLHSAPPLRDVYPTMRGGLRAPDRTHLPKNYLHRDVAHCRLYDQVAPPTSDVALQPDAAVSVEMLLGIFYRGSCGVWCCFRAYRQCSVSFS